MKVIIKIITDPADFQEVVELHNIIASNINLSTIPNDILISSIRTGGLLIGVYNQNQQNQLVGFVFGFPGIYYTSDAPRLMHYSHILAIHPNYLDRNLGFKLKRAQWQMVRHQGIDRICWIYDPLLSRNAYLYFTKLGAVCSQYYESYFGAILDEENELATDRLMVDWWVNTERVNRKLSKHARKKLDLAHYLASGAQILNPTRLQQNGLPTPAEFLQFSNSSKLNDAAIILVEIPSDITIILNQDYKLAKTWREHTRNVFKIMFARGIT